MGLFGIWGIFVGAFLLGHFLLLEEKTKNKKEWDLASNVSWGFLYIYILSFFLSFFFSLRIGLFIDTFFVLGSYVGKEGDG